MVGNYWSLSKTSQKCSCSSSNTHMAGRKTITLLDTRKKDGKLQSMMFKDETTKKTFNHLK